MKITRVEEYKLYLKKEVAKFIKNEKKAVSVVEELYNIFIDGVKHGHGKLEIDI